jgi:hypothetical protein
MNRRTFLISLGAATAVAALAPQVFTSVPPPLPILYGDGIHDDSVALQAWLDGKLVRGPNESPVSPYLIHGKHFWLSRTLYWHGNGHGITEIMDCHFEWAPFAKPHTPCLYTPFSEANENLIFTRCSFVVPPNTSFRQFSYLENRMSLPFQDDTDYTLRG